MTKPVNENTDDETPRQKTESEQRRALYEAASSLASSTHMDSLRDFAIAVRDVFELPDEYAARVEAEQKRDAALKKQTR